MSYIPRGILSYYLYAPHVYINCGHVHGFHVWGKSTDQTEEERPCPICQEVCFHITYMHHMYTSTVAMSMVFMFGLNQTEEERLCPICREVCFHITYMQHMYTSTVAMSMAFMFAVNLPIKQRRKDRVLYVERYIFVLLICSTCIHQRWPCPVLSCLG